MTSTAVESPMRKTNRLSAPRGTRQTRRAQPLGRRRVGLSTRQSWSSLFILIALIAFALPLASAQGTGISSGTSASTTISPSPISSRTSTSASSASSSSAPSPTPTLVLSSFPALLSLPPLNSSHPVLQLDISPTSDPFFISFSICSLTSNSSLLPTVLVSTATPPLFSLGTSVTLEEASGGTKEAGFNRKNRDANTWELVWGQGFGNWTGTGTGAGTAGGSGIGVLLGLGLNTDGSARGVSATGNVVIQIGLSTTGPLQSVTTLTPYFGDTTSTSALIFSPLLAASPHEQPVYPNYTLPPAQLVLSAQPTTGPIPASADTLSLVMVPSGSSPTADNLGHSVCAVRAANASTGGVAEARNLLVNRTDPGYMEVGGEEGFRSFWVVGDLVAEGSNYTAWTINESTGEMSSPIWLTTKEETFPCPLVLPNDICPSIGYAGALNPNSTNPVSPVFTLSNDFIANLTSSLQAFSTSLLSQACGRDLYSHVSTCADCYSSYRDWLCRVAIPRCASSIPSTAYPPAASIARTPDNPRNPMLPAPAFSYTELLPCLAVCNGVDRACPVNMQFRCPVRGVTANQSYAFLGSEADQGDGSSETGPAAADVWGNRWCNG